MVVIRETISKKEYQFFLRVAMLEPLDKKQSVNKVIKLFLIRKSLWEYQINFTEKKKEKLLYLAKRLEPDSLYGC